MTLFPPSQIRSAKSSQEISLSACSLLFTFLLICNITTREVSKRFSLPKIREISRQYLFWDARNAVKLSLFVKLTIVRSICLSFINYSPMVSAIILHCTSFRDLRTHTPSRKRMSWSVLLNPTVNYVLYLHLEYISPSDNRPNIYPFFQQKEKLMRLFFRHCKCSS